MKCPDCNAMMTQHTLKYLHHKRGYCKAKAPSRTQEVIETPPPPKPVITHDIVNDYINENPEIVFIYLRNERAMKA